MDEGFHPNNKSVLIIPTFHIVDHY